jgi:hypothetical protein
MSNIMSEVLKGIENINKAAASVDPEIRRMVPQIPPIPERPLTAQEMKFHPADPRQPNTDRLDDARSDYIKESLQDVRALTRAIDTLMSDLHRSETLPRLLANIVQSKNYDIRQASIVGLETVLSTVFAEEFDSRMDER